MKETLVIQRIFLVFLIFNIGKGQAESKPSKKSITVIQDAPLAGFFHKPNPDLQDLHGDPTTTTSTTTTTTTTTPAITTSASTTTSTKATPSVTPTTTTTRTSTTHRPITYRPYLTYGENPRPLNEYKSYNNEPEDEDDAPKYDSKEPGNSDEDEDGYENEDK